MIERHHFTFGSDHVNPITGETLRQKYVTLYGTADRTRAEMLRRFGKAWAAGYPDERWMEQVEKYDLTRLPLSGPLTQP